MRLNTVRIYHETGDEFVLYPLGDVHFGSASCDTALLDHVIAEIRGNPNARWLGMGDMCEFISPTDLKRWDAAGLDKSVVSLDSEGHISDVYVRKMAAKLKPIAGQLIAYGDGNHEQAHHKYHGSHVSWRVLEMMGLGAEDPDQPPPLYTGWACLTRIVFHSRGRKVPMRIYHAHGWQGGRMDGAKVNGMERMLAWIDADIYCHGHSHSRFVVPVDRLRTNQSFTKIVADRTYVAHTGSFLKTYKQDSVSYAERACYPPTSLGVVKFRLRPHDTGVDIEAVQ